MGTIEAWHFLQQDRRLRWGTQEVVEVGKTYRCEGEIFLCENGMHGSKRILDALKYAPGPVCCRVRLWGDVREGGDKLAARNREVLSMADISSVLHEFACRCAEHALKRAHVTDKRSWAAIEAKRAWLRGDISDTELVTAIAAASDAAWAAARATAIAAARAAAWDAARDAAWAAARATGDASWAAARDAQNRLLQNIVKEIL